MRGLICHMRESVTCFPKFVLSLLQLAIDVLVGHIAAQIQGYISHAPLKLDVAG